MDIIMREWDKRLPEQGDYGRRFDPNADIEPQKWWPDKGKDDSCKIPPAVTYDDLNSKQKETLNFHTVAALLAQRGYDCFRLNDDWQGADFIAGHIDGHVRRVQLKARLAIAEKYRGKQVDLAFPVKRSAWYLVPHDTLVEFVFRHASTWLESEAWVKEGTYQSASPSAALVEALAPFALESAEGHRP